MRAVEGFCIVFLDFTFDSCPVKNGHLFWHKIHFFLPLLSFSLCNFFFLFSLFLLQMVVCNYEKERKKKTHWNYANTNGYKMLDMDILPGISFNDYIFSVECFFSICDPCTLSTTLRNLSIWLILFNWYDIDFFKWFKILLSISWCFFTIHKTKTKNIERTSKENGSKNSMQTVI